MANTMGNNDEKAAAAAAAAMVKCREVRTQDDHNDQRITQIFLSPQLRYGSNFRRFNIIYELPRSNRIANDNFAR